MEELRTDIWRDWARGRAGCRWRRARWQMEGAVSVLIEAGEMGGDCLNAGCVPSKGADRGGGGGRSAAGIGRASGWRRWSLRWMPGR